MKKLLLFTVLLLFVSCSDDDGETQVIDDPLALLEMMNGKWRLLKVEYTDENGVTTTIESFCTNQSTYEFFVTGTFEHFLYVEGASEDETQCHEFTSEGRWRPASNPDNPDQNIQMITDTIDGNDRFGDWGYVQVVFMGSNQMQMLSLFGGRESYLYFLEKVN